MSCPEAPDPVNRDGSGRSLVARRRRQIVWAAAAMLVVASLAIGWWAVRTANSDQAAAQRDDRRRSSTRRDTRALVAREGSTRRAIAALEATLRTRTEERDAVGASLYSAIGKLHDAQATLAREASGLQALDARVGALRGCLHGVEGALNALAIGDSRTALTRLRAVGADCDAAA